MVVTLTRAEAGEDCYRGELNDRGNCCPKDCRQKPPSPLLKSPCFCFGSGKDTDLILKPREGFTQEKLNKFFDLIYPLGITVGRATSRDPLPTNPEDEDVLAQRFAMILKAFAKSYLIRATKWSTKVIETIIKEGLMLYNDSKALQDFKEDGSSLHSSMSQVSASDFKEMDRNILAYRRFERHIQRQFTMDGHGFHIELEQKFYLDRELDAEVKENWSRFYDTKANPYDVDLREKEHEDLEEEQASEGYDLNDDLRDPDLPLGELRRHLEAYFQSEQYGLIQVNNCHYFLIWREDQVYFVFDFNGRSLNDFTTDYTKGFAMLLVFRSLANVLFLIENLSGLKPTTNNVFNIRNIRLVRLTSPQGFTKSLEFGYRFNEWQTLDPHYALLKADLHLPLKPWRMLRNRSALTVALAALLASKIDHPALWTRRILLRLFCYGVNLCWKCLQQQCPNDPSRPLDLQTFPRNLTMGQFQILYDFFPLRYTSYFKCVPNQENTDFALTLRQAFANNDTRLLLQLSNQVYAIWKQAEFYFLLDPYRHRLPQATKSSSKPAKRSASLRLFCDFESLIKVLTDILLESNETSMFHLHVLKIKSIDFKKNKKNKKNKNKKPKEYPEECPEESLQSPEDKDEVQSLNEEICFDDDDLKCYNQLKLISDEETGSDEEIPMSEYEEEAVPGEENEEDYQQNQQKKHKKPQNKHKKKNRKVTKYASESDSDLDSASAPLPTKSSQKALKNGEFTPSGEHQENRKEKPSDPQGPRRNRKEPKKHPPRSQAPDKTLQNLKKAKASDLTPASNNHCAAPPGGKAQKLLNRYLEQVRCLASEFSLASPTSKPYGLKAQETQQQPAYDDCTAYDMVVVGSASGSFASIYKLLCNGFRQADRIYLITPWSNYVVFRGWNLSETVYFLFDGCTCDLNRFRHLDLATGTSGLLSFPRLKDVVHYIVETRGLSSLSKTVRFKLSEILGN